MTVFSAANFSSRRSNSRAGTDERQRLAGVTVDDGGESAVPAQRAGGALTERRARHRGKGCSSHNEET